MEYMNTVTYSIKVFDALVTLVKKVTTLLLLATLKAL